VKDLLPALQQWEREGVEAGRAVLVRAFGSSPVPEGSVLLVAEDGRIAGSVSGGCVEAAAADEVGRARADRCARLVRYGITDEQAWNVGLACGSTIDVLVEASISPEVLAAAAASDDRAVVTLLPQGDPEATEGRVVLAPSPLPVLTLDGGVLDVPPPGPPEDAGVRSELATHARRLVERGLSVTVEIAGRSWFVESFPVRPRLVVVGAGQVAIALVRMARQLGYETIVIDGRASFATRERFPDVDRLQVGWPDEIFPQISLAAKDAVAVLTHDPKFDEPAIVEALRRGCRYVGSIGSRRTHAARRERLRAAGLSDEDLARMRGPIGLDLGGRRPAEIALSILAEVVAVRHGGTGEPMRDRR
jgi:xanthine dehydrogenase accessory factor